MTTTFAVDTHHYDSAYIEGFLSSYQEFVRDAPEMAADWPDMEQEERVIQRSALTPSWEKRTLLGALYLEERLSESQVTRLRQLDEQLLEHAAAVELAYGPSLGELLRYLFRVGTPLSDHAGVVRVETTASALADLVKVAPS
jgi:hypothetical protein